MQLYIIRKGKLVFKFVSDKPYSNAVAEAKRVEVTNLAREFGQDETSARASQDYWSFIVGIPETFGNKDGYTVVDDYIVVV